MPEECAIEYHGMKFVELHGNLFDYLAASRDRRDAWFQARQIPFVPDGAPVVIVHCISADVAMGAGFAQQFVDHVGDEVRESIRRQTPAVGDAVFSMGAYHLVTKEHYYNKPTQSDFLDALDALASQLIGGPNKLVLMPKLGCGLDKLEWEWVKQCVTSVLAGWDGIVVAFV